MDLKNLIEPKARYVFFSDKDLNFAFPIVHVDQDFIYFTSKNPIELKFNEGYFLAQNNSGIVKFTNPEIQTLKKSDKQKNDLLLHRFDFTHIDHSISNRRNSVRFKFKEFIPLHFNIFGETMMGQLINISQGGLRMCIDTPIKTNILCNIEINLPMNGQHQNIKTNGMVVYAGREEDTKKIMVGICFVTPELVSLNERGKYTDTQNVLKEYISYRDKTNI
ncbi:hypothetical protein BVY03_03560 [bacterium K02(2017)]|nr:hypothetical protein BVY03_03560 [bacterium K02(2017)]